MSTNIVFLMQKLKWSLYFQIYLADNSSADYHKDQFHKVLSSPFIIWPLPTSPPCFISSGPITVCGMPTCQRKIIFVLPHKDIIRIKLMHIKCIIFIKCLISTWCKNNINSCCSLYVSCIRLLSEYQRHNNIFSSGVWNLLKAPFHLLTSLSSSCFNLAPFS